MRRLIIAGLLLGPACGGDHRAVHAPAVLDPIATMTDRGVTVEISFNPTTSGAGRLCGRFAPTKPGFHLYATELPMDGIRGIGRPTRLNVDSSLFVRTTGAVVADQPVTRLTVVPLGLTFPVYPEGPVSLCVPISLAGVTADSARISITYMTCSDQVCMPPVEDRRITVALNPAESGRVPER